MNADFTIPQPNCMNFPKEAWKRYGYRKRWFRNSYLLRRECRDGLRIEIVPTCWSYIRVRVNGFVMYYAKIESLDQFHSVMEEIHYDLRDRPQEFMLFTARRARQKRHRERRKY